MKLLLARHLWGVSAPYIDALQLFKHQGYEAIETGLIYCAEPKDQLLSQLQELNLKWIPMIFTEGNSVRDHLNSFTQQIKNIAPYQPILINSHSGRDAFTRAEADEFFREALKIELDINIPIAHETHRGRILFNPWITRDLLLTHENLKLCCDYSHWVTVCERLIDTEFEILKLCAERYLHIHARVGFEQGPQVADPRAPEYTQHVEAHERWWDMIWQARKKSGKSFTTMTPEFGPPPYLPTLPYSQNPVASQDEICLWQMQRLRDRFVEQEIAA